MFPSGMTSVIIFSAGILSEISIMLENSWCVIATPHTGCPGAGVIVGTYGSKSTV